MDFFYCRRSSDLIVLSAALYACFGRFGMWKVLLKLLAGRRVFYGIMHSVAGESIVHYGWISLGFCRYYPVERSAAVVGPVWTAPVARGGGLAIRALKLALNELAQAGIERVYIDTSEDNAAMLRVIRHCGFDVLAGEYQRRYTVKPGGIFRFNPSENGKR